MIEIGKKILSKYKSSLSFRYLGLSGIFLMGIQVLLAIAQVKSSYQEKIDTLTQRVEDTANFLGVLRQESSITLDDKTLARLLNQTNLDQDLVYGVVLNAQGNPVGIFLTKRISLIGQSLENEQQHSQGILEFIETLKREEKIREIRRPILVDNYKIGRIILGYSVQGLRQEVFKQAQTTLTGAVLLGGLVFLILWFLYEREIHSPLQELAGNVREKNQLLGNELDESQKDIIEQLKTIFGSLTENQPQGIKLQPQLTAEQSEATVQLMADENLAKSRFLAMVGHELRTPLNAVTGMTGLLLDTKLTSQQKEFVNIIRTSGETLLTMINNILDFAKIEAKKIELEEHPFELGECIEDALRLFISQASEKKLELAYLIEPHTPSAIVGDVTRLQQILVNLLSNAVKFTEAGEVVVYVNATPISEATEDDFGVHEIRFAVKDTGIGIPADRMERLFKSFSQVDVSTSRKYGGTGLGLVISKRLAEMMGGKMWVHSVEGKGSTFYFTVQAKAARSLAPANLPSAEEILGGKSLLIVDDIVTNQKILQHQANSWGMLTCTVESASKALEWLKQKRKCDVAILDMNMPPYDGVTLAKEIRKLPHCRTLPLVLLSSLGKPDTDKSLGEIKFAAILTKPIQQSQLYDVLVRVLQQKPIIVNKTSIPEEHEKLADTVPLRILVAEDVSVNQEVIRLQLEKLGYLPDIVSNGKEVLEAMRRQNYDVVLMDVRMPDMDGITATYHIRQEWHGDVRPRIIAMTADAMQGDREKCLAAGMDEYLAKPVRLEELKKVLSHCQSIQGKSPAIDHKVLESLKQMAGKRAPVVICELIQSYLEDSPAQLEACLSALRANDPAGLHRAVHALRSASVQLGGIQLAHLCQELETLARAGTLVGAAEKLSAIDFEYHRVCRALEDELASLALLSGVKAHNASNRSLLAINDNN